MFKWFDKVSIFDKIYLLLIILAAIVLFIKYKRLTHNVRILPFFILAHFSAEFFSLYLHYKLNLKNYFVYHLFAYISYTLLSIFFYHTYKDIFSKRLVIISIPLYAMLSLFYVAVWEPFTKYNSLSFMTEHLFVIAWCLLFYKKILGYNEPYRPEKDRTFWIINGLLFYFLGNFFVLTFYNYIEKYRPDIITPFYYSSYIFNYLLYVIIIAVGVIKFPVDRPL